MKKIHKILGMLTLTIALFGCSNEADRDSSLHDDYSLYYSYKGNLKGVEVYCWKRRRTWESGLLLGTNRAKMPDEVKYLQDNLPCPLPKMKEILSEYKKEEIGLVCIVDVPPVGLNYVIDESNKDDYVYVCDQLGIDFPSGQLYSVRSLPEKS